MAESRLKKTKSTRVLFVESVIWSLCFHVDAFFLFYVCKYTKNSLIAMSQNVKKSTKRDENPPFSAKK